MVYRNIKPQRLLPLLALLCTLASHSASAMLLKYRFESTGFLLSTDPALLMELGAATPISGGFFITSGSMAGTFTYDNSVTSPTGPVSTPVGDALVYSGAVSGAAGVLTASASYAFNATGGAALTWDGTLVNGPYVNEDQLTNTVAQGISSSFSGFTLGAYELISVNTVNFFGNDFLPASGLPPLLPPPGHDGSNTQMVFRKADGTLSNFFSQGVTLTRIPAPATLLLLACGLAGLLRLSRRGR